MKTISTLKKEVNIKQLLSNNEYQLSEKDLIETEVKMMLKYRFQNASRIIGLATGSTTLTRYEINNEEILNTLRSFYQSTTNNFVKKVVATVGKNKMFSDDQIDFICEEMLNTNNLEITFS